MSPETPADGGARAPRKGGGAPPAWLRHAAIWVGAGLAVVALVVLGVAVLPGWWASVVSSWVQGVFGRGVPIGLGVGALFTLLPLGVALLTLRRGLSVRTRAVLIAIALLLLLPNVLTIAIALGRGDPRSVLAIAAPGFRGATVVGIALVIAVLLALVLIRRRSRRTRTMIAEAGDKAAQVSRDRAQEREAALEESRTEPVDPDRPAVIEGRPTPGADPAEPDPDAVQEPPAEPRTR